MFMSAGAGVMLFIPPTEAQFVATCLEKFLIISQDLKNLCAPLP